MQWWQAAILGLVEGITEFLPISSTGHLIIAASLMDLDDADHKHSLDAFNIVIQGGAILAVLGLYRARVAHMVAGLFGRNPAGLRLAIRLLIAFLPAAILGVLLNDVIESKLFHSGPVLAALFLGGIYMIAIDRRRMRHHRTDEPTADASETNAPCSSLDTMTLRSAIIIGLMQCIAMWPGTSRSMMTITAGVLTGLKPKDAAEFSFLLGLPTLGGACVWKLASNIRDSRAEGVPNIFEVYGPGILLIGLGVATASAILAVRWLVGFLNRHGLEAFGWYRIALAIVLGTLIWAGKVTVDHTLVEEDSQPPQPALANS